MTDLSAQLSESEGTVTRPSLCQKNRCPSATRQGGKMHRCCPAFNRLNLDFLTHSQSPPGAALHWNFIPFRHLAPRSAASSSANCGRATTTTTTSPASGLGPAGPGSRRVTVTARWAQHNSVKRLIVPAPRNLNIDHRSDDTIDTQ
eukprot:1080412-Rhodomonas_salina.1